MEIILYFLLKPTFILFFLFFPHPNLIFILLLFLFFLTFFLFHQPTAPPNIFFFFFYSFSFTFTDYFSLFLTSLIRWQWCERLSGGCGGERWCMQTGRYGSGVGCRCGWVFGSYGDERGDCYCGCVVSEFPHLTLAQKMLSTFKKRKKFTP